MVKSKVTTARTMPEIILFLSLNIITLFSRS
jgi:hypothetical protein